MHVFILYFCISIPNFIQLFHIIPFQISIYGKYVKYNIATTQQQLSANLINGFELHDVQV